MQSQVVLKDGSSRCPRCGRVIDIDMVGYMSEYTVTQWDKDDLTIAPEEVKLDVQCKCGMCMIWKLEVSAGSITYNPDTVRTI